MTAGPRFTSAAASAMLAVLSSFGCGDDTTPGTGGGGGSVPTSSGTGVTASSNASSTSAGSTTAVSGSTTAMSSSSTGGTACTPGAQESCYDGPPGTEGVGTCTAGIATCNDRGTALGPCIGEVLPGVEPCGSSQDENCDGVILPCAKAE